MKFCRWNHYAFPGWHVQVGRAGKKSQTPSPAFQRIRFQLARSFLLCFFLLDGAKVEQWESQKVAGDIFSATECKITKMPPTIAYFQPSCSTVPRAYPLLVPLPGYFRPGVLRIPWPRSVLACSSFSSARELLGWKPNISDSFSFCCFAS